MIQTCTHCGKPVAAVTTPRRLRFAIGRIARLVSDELGVPKHAVLSRSKYAAASEARSLCFWLARKHTKFGVAQIGRAAGRHHTTVIAGIRRAERLMQAPEFRSSAERVAALLTRELRSEGLVAA